MSFDSRLREELRRTADSAPRELNPDTLAGVVQRAAVVRRERRTTAAVMALVALLVGGALLGTSSGVLRHHTAPAAPTPSPSSSPTQAFASPLYGYRVSYPMGWTVTPARTAWVDGQTSERDPAASDVFQSPDGPALYLAVLTLPAGTTDAAWYSAFSAAHTGVEMPACYGPLSSWTPENIGGHPGYLLGGMAGCSFTEALTIVGGRVYSFTGMTDPSSINQGVFDAAVLHLMFDTITFPTG